MTSAMMTSACSHAHIAQWPNPARQIIEHVLAIALRGLPQMYRRDSGLFTFTCRKRDNDGVQQHGESLRYSCIVVLGVALLDEAGQRAILGGETAREFCGRLLSRIEHTNNLGDLALLIWCAAAVEHPHLPHAIERLDQLNGTYEPCETVAAAWVLSALLAAHKHICTQRLFDQARARLVQCFNHAGGLFPHYTSPLIAPLGRSHVACFADQVYPILALSQLARATGDEFALSIANRCAAQIVSVQGAAGQWWWHYDVHHGSVIEGYPVYSVHQNAMAPMALLALADAGGTNHKDATARGLAWLEHAPEIGRSLIDDDRSVIWRKIGRSDVRKLVRFSRAVANRIHPRLTLQPLNWMFQPTVVDFECRPYHLGWILYTWLGR